MRALWFTLKNVQWVPEAEGYHAKVEWRLAFKAKLDELISKEIRGALTGNEGRHHVYAVNISPWICLSVASLE